nr:uncharacterized protein LOC117218922 [Megalopta genalis]
MNCERLITLVEKRRSLWDPKHSQYHNREVCRRLWSEIATLLNTTSSAVKIKWQHLRDTHRREIGRNNRFVESGLQNESKWKYFDLMGFLQHSYYSRRLVRNSFETSPLNHTINESEHVSDKETESCEDIEKNEEDDDEIIEEMQVFKRPQQRPQEIKHPIHELFQLREDNIQHLKGLIVSANEDRTIVDDEDYFFVMSLLPHLRAIPRQKKLRTRIKIQQLIMEETSELCTVPSLSPSGSGRSTDSGEGIQMLRDKYPFLA